MYQIYTWDTEFLIPTYGDSFFLPDTSHQSGIQAVLKLLRSSLLGHDFTSALFWHKIFSF